MINAKLVDTHQWIKYQTYDPESIDIYLLS